MNKNYKYDAFISYRHCEPDKFVAENLHKILETYELPKNIKEKLNIEGRTIKRIFRDQEELPLSSNLEDPIVEALNSSKYLIVICSPRLKESLWCKKEIETFKKIRGRENIFCVLVEGEPNESFPEEVLFDEIKTKDKSGKTKTEKVYFEPLAADVRGESNKEILKKIKEEKLRLIAPMYNLNYDDLKQRHKLRKMKQIIALSCAVTIFCFLFAIYSTFMFLKINNQQKKLKLNQAQTLSEKSNKYLKKDSKYNAVKAAYEALTKYNGVKMPYTANAEYALVESLGIYNAGLSYKASSELKTKGVIDFVRVSKDNNYALTYDESEELVLWDLNKLKKINSYSNIDGFSFDDHKFTFIGEEKIAYVNKDGNVVIYSIKNNKKLKEIKKNKYSYKSIRCNIKGEYLLVNDSPNLYVYNTSNFEELSKYTSKEEILSDLYYSISGKFVFIITSKNSININEKDDITVHVLDTKTLKEQSSFKVDSRYIENIVENGDNIYLLTNQSVGTDFDMVVTSYNYKNDKVNWTKKFSKNWGKIIAKSYAEGVNTLAVANSNIINIINQSNGNVVQTFALNSDVIGIFSSLSSDLYIAFTANGEVHFLSLKYNESIIYKGLFNLNLDNYTDVIKNNSGYLFSAQNENRLIYYEQESNKKIKKLNIKLDYISDDTIKLSDYDKVKKKFNIKKKNLVSKMMYDDKKHTLFITYKDNTLGIYDVKTKKFIKMLDGIKDVSHYFGKDKNNRAYIGNITDSYILDKDFNKVGHINNLAKLDKKKNNVIIMHNEEFYSLPIYDLEDLLKEAKDYLNK